MSGVPGVRLRGVALAIDTIDTLERLMRSEARTVADALGQESPIARRLHSHAEFARNRGDLVKSDNEKENLEPERMTSIEVPANSERG